MHKMCIMPDPLEAFRGVAQPCLDRKCNALVASFMAQMQFLNAPPEWRSLSTSVIFVPPDYAVPGYIGERIFEWDRFRAARGIVSFEKLESLFRGIEAGRLNKDCIPDGWTEEISLFDDSARPPPFQKTFFHEPAMYSRPRIDFPSYQVAAYGASTTNDADFWEAFSMLGRKLSAWNTPFDGLEGLAQDLMLPSVPQQAQVPTVQLISPFWVKLLGVRPNQSSRKAVITIESIWGELPPELSISLIPLDGLRRSRRLMVAELKWDRDLGTMFRTEVPAEEGPLKVCLNFAGETISSEMTGLGSSRLVSHLIADPEAAWLRSCLLGKESKDSQNFEIACAWLFHLLGFSSTHHGYKRLQRTVDVLAFLDEQQVIFIECSVEQPDSAKLNDVKTRAENFSSASTRPGREMTVLSIVATNAPTKPEPSLAPEVLVLDRGDLAHLLEQLEHGVHAADLFEEFLQKRDQQVQLVQYTS